MRAALDDALLEPVRAPRLAAFARGLGRITLVVSDATRDEPRREMIDAVLAEVGADRVRILVAAGTHRDTCPRDILDLGLPVTLHDADSSELVAVGDVESGVRVHPLLIDTDLVIATARVRPHYFAGFSGGAKTLFPGCADRQSVLANHLLKGDKRAVLGRVEDNPCRIDMEASAARIETPVFILNLLCDIDGQAVVAAAGDMVRAHRVLAKAARSLFSVRVPRCDALIVADRPPVTQTLYQACKMLPPAGACLRPGGVVVMLAECDQGLGPLDRVNEGIYGLGIRPKLPEGHRVVLVSRRTGSEVGRTFAQHAPSLAIARQQLGLGDDVPVLWRAAESIVGE